MYKILFLFLICFSLANNVFFSPNGECRQRLIELIQNTTQDINIAIYSFTSKEIALALLGEKNKGRKIKIVSDRHQSQNKYSQLDFLANHLPVRILPLPQKKRGSMHHKFMVIGGFVATGSYNWSQNAEYYNNENLIVMNDANAAQAYLGEFKKIWKYAKPWENKLK